MAIREIVDYVEKATEEEVDCILNAVFQRRRKLFPDWDMIYFALPKNDPAERKRLLEQSLEVLMKE